MAIILHEAKSVRLVYLLSPESGRPTRKRPKIRFKLNADDTAANW